MPAFNADSRLVADFIENTKDSAYRSGDMERYLASVQMSADLHSCRLAVVEVALVERLVESLAAQTQAVDLALACVDCDIGAEHRSMLVHDHARKALAAAKAVGFGKART